MMAKDQSARCRSDRETEETRKEAKGRGSGRGMRRSGEGAGGRRGAQLGPDFLRILAFNKKNY